MKQCCCNSKTKRLVKTKIAVPFWLRLYYILVLVTVTEDQYTLVDSHFELVASVYFIIQSGIEKEDKPMSIIKILQKDSDKQCYQYDHYYYQMRDRRDNTSNCE